VDPRRYQGEMRIETPVQRATGADATADDNDMAERENIPEEGQPGHRARVDRHRIAATAAPAPPAAPQHEEPAAPAIAIAPEHEEAAAPAIAPERDEAAAPAVAPTPTAPAAKTAPPALTPALRRWRARRAAPPSQPPKDQTRDALRRPALLSDRCVSCGASTKGRQGMVTELVEVGPIRALRVVACSACPDRRRRALAGL
jgi:hypothetical protein